MVAVENVRKRTKMGSGAWRSSKKRSGALGQQWGSNLAVVGSVLTQNGSIRKTMDTGRKEQAQEHSSEQGAVVEQ